MKVLITGIDFSNFGSLAMLEVVKRYLDGETLDITHVSPKSLGATVDERNVIVMRIRDYIKLFLVPVSLDRLLLTSSQCCYREHFLKADAIFDISGFALSSQFPISTTLRFLAPILLGAKHGLSIVLMPQSFGPFNYSYNWIVMPFIKWVLRKVASMYARDASSLKYLSAEGINATSCDDLVFLYQNSSPLKNISFEESKRYVGVVTNRHLLRLCSHDELISSYKETLTYLIDKGFVPVLFSHTLQDDLKLLANIAKAIQESEATTSSDYVYIDQQLSLPDLFYLYSRFDFIIASRFHSIVLNFANKKPALIIGWADKYKELSQEFEQQAYFTGVNAKSMISSIDRLIENKSTETKKIAKVLDIKRNRCARILKQHLTLLETH